jgi:hypothetical protein
MWSKSEELRFSVMLGLRKGLKLIRGARRTFTEDEQRIIAQAIVEDLEGSNWKIESGAPARANGSELMGPKKEKCDGSK